MNIFSSLPKGDSAYWHDEPVSDSQGKSYDSGAYALAYILAGPIATPLTLTAVADGNGWKTTLTATDSASLVPGKYWWQAVLTRTGERVSAGQGELTITANLGAVTGTFDGRSIAEKALADAETALASFQASGGKIKRYTIGSRTMEFHALAELLQVISYWRARVLGEQGASQIAQGLGNPRKLFVRFR